MANRVNLPSDDEVSASDVSLSEVEDNVESINGTPEREDELFKSTAIDLTTAKRPRKVPARFKDSASVHDEAKFEAEMKNSKLLR